MPGAITLLTGTNVRGHNSAHITVHRYNCQGPIILPTGTNVRDHNSAHMSVCMRQEVPEK